MKVFQPRNPDLLCAWRWTDRGLYLLDQRKLPAREVYVHCRTWQEVRRAIKDMVVRGAPAIGITAAIGLVLGAERLRARTRRAFLSGLKRIAQGLAKARPTAVNLFWALERMVKRAEAEAAAGPQELLEILRAEALSLWEEDLEACRRMGALGAGLLPEEGTVLTHCNAGALATGGYGTALGVIRAAVEAGKRLSVLADETRPYLQGARLTAWELHKVGIPVTVIPDAAAGFLMARGRVQAVIVGADRIAANGDVANKIGTYSLAVLARENGIPFYVAAPSSTFDLTCFSGEGIPIEERAAEEVHLCAGRRITPRGVSALNPAFDVTPAPYVTALITEKGIIQPPYPENIPRVLSGETPTS
ncbi:S-methyl-5-thioribose-1-phosphate isomerase [Thermosulfurimonas marina]|uniref:Methylthioribose-1-phosphate isomerase n=1 Tax=Thermosulfurimonas marina TaxID=2047767 RepID=A0A6H1WT31_9BACT|nr:S-methyl-5-thioribose-1-phosphate isomerase [Thermosulfurimonas marina]QJA06330.1 S-methyl-5-thioribose-1-phosphate isomerase [Thermosulfurimonas marina]